jgi:hypothetical protein
LVAALAGGDYLLWTWSSEGNSATLALISGLALAPLILALLWLASVTIARGLLTRSSRPRARSAATPGSASPRRKAVARFARTGHGRNRLGTPAVADLWQGEESNRSTERQAPSQKIAA